ncbi:hypothetical protein [Singulisphaera sp. PoT]|uniref:hypothetical protein n=1 Tax=Singulisphaera sp. PoT TaxID=3411797 RepID=UPI003BF5BB2B
MSQHDLFNLTAGQIRLNDEEATQRVLSQAILSRREVVNSLARLRPARGQPHRVMI